MGSHKDLIVYKKAFDVAMRIFQATKKFPAEERYSLTDQIRRSSRAVCANLAEAYRKREYSAHFTAKISDADMKSTETQTWLDFALSCNYMHKEEYEYCAQQITEVGRLLQHMKRFPEKYQPKQ
ncbi:MAG TPA: four helix bundle protein [Chitinophaga sp.]